MILKDKKVMITGGSGMIGRELIDLLLEKECDLYVASIDNDVDLPKGVRFKYADLRNFQNCMEVMKGIDVVFNLVGIKASPKILAEKPASSFVPHLQFNTNTMEAAMRNNVKWYMYTSTVGVYETKDKEILSEDDVWNTFPSKNDWFGGWAKRMGELQVDAYNIQYKTKKISIVRPGNVYGKYDNFDPENAMVIPSLIRKSYTTPGIKTIKSIVFSYDDMTNQVGRWKLVTSRFFLDIPINQYPDFAEVGGSDYTTIPWPYTTPVIGGVDNDSKYKKSVQDTLSGGKILDTELIDERFLVNDLENDELGKSVKDMDLEQIRYFNKSYELNQLLNINPILSTLMEGDLSFLEDEYLLSLPYPEFFNQFDINQDAVLTSDDSDIWVNEYGRPDIAYEVSNIVSQVEEIQNQPSQELIGQVKMSRTQQYGFNYASAWFGELGEGYYDGSSNPDMANWQGLIPGGVDDPMDSYGQMGYELDNFSNHETCKYFYPQCLTQNCIAIFEDNNNQNNGPLFGNYVYDCYTTQDSVNSVLPPREHFVGLIGLARNTWESGEGYLDDNDGLWYGIGPFEDYYTFPDNVEQFVSHVGGYEFDIPNFACAEVFGGNAMSDGNVELGDYETTEFDSIVSKNGQIWKIYQCLDKRLLTSNDEPIIETPSESEYYNGQALGYYEFDYRPYNYINDDESLYWDGETNKFPEESSVGQIFITENQDLDLKQNCKLELNTGQLSGKSIYDSSGNSNKGLLIGDYKVKKVRKGEPMRRDSFIKVPKKTGNKDGAL